MLFLPPLLACAYAAGSAVEEVEAAFVSLFDGKTLDGWKQVGGIAKYRVGGDEIVGTVGPAMKGNSFLLCPVLLP